MPQIALLYSTAGHYHSSPRLFHASGSDGIGVLHKALTTMLDDQNAVQIVSEHHLTGSMSQWPLIVVPGWGYLDPAFRDRLSAYAHDGGRLVLIGAGPTKLFRRELAVPKDAEKHHIVAIASANGALSAAIGRIFPEPLVEVSGSDHVDVSPRRLDGRLTVHLVNTAGPHANAPDEGITSVPPVGPLTVAIRLDRAPKKITLEPEHRRLLVSWSNGRASVTVPRLDIYSVLTVDE